MTQGLAAAAWLIPQTPERLHPALGTPASSSPTDVAVVAMDHTRYAPSTSLCLYLNTLWVNYNNDGVAAWGAGMCSTFAPYYYFFKRMITEWSC